jgi:hypothetical protein
MTSKLAPHQIAQDVYDEANSAIRTTLQNLEISMELSADDGDSVEARAPLFTGRAVVVAAGVSSGDVVAQGDVKYFSEYLVACQSTGVISSGLHIEIEVSPSDTDDVWHHDSQMIADLNIPSSGFSHIKESNIGPWRRARAKVIFNNFSAGSFVLYVNGR